MLLLVARLSLIPVTDTPVIPIASLNRGPAPGLQIRTDANLNADRNTDWKCLACGRLTAPGGPLLTGCCASPRMRARCKPQQPTDCYNPKRKIT